LQSWGEENKEKERRMVEADGCLLAIRRTWGWGRAGQRVFMGSVGNSRLAHQVLLSRYHGNLMSSIVIIFALNHRALSATLIL
jgi:hypothetical protein